MGYQISTPEGVSIRGSLPLTPAERKPHHTVQESVGADLVARTALHQLDLRGSEHQPKVLLSGNDNMAALKNIDRPGNKPQMVIHH